jgi:thiol-disulfide isomerase/thioredoxin
MVTILLIARLLLALVFVVAGVGKLTDRKGSRQAIIDFGLPAALATPLSILLPLAELTVAASLIPTASAWWGALGTLTLLLLFIGGIGINLARGRKPECHCFGQLHSSPAGWSTLVRNGLLAAVAGFILWAGREAAGPSALSWLGTLSTTQGFILIGGLILLALLAGQWWLFSHLFKQNGRLLIRLEALENTIASRGAIPSQNGAHQAPPGLPVGAAAPAFSLSGLYGETLTLESLRSSGKPVMLLFTDPNCGPCNALLPEIGRWQQEHADKLTITLVSRSSAEENSAKSTEHGVGNVLLQEDWEVAQAFQVSGTPSALIVQPDGTIGSLVVGGSEAISALVSCAVEEPSQLPMFPALQGEPCPNCGKVHPTNHDAQQDMPAGKVGEPAPPIELPDLNGNPVDLEDYRGEKTLVLFWNPGCGFCQQMLPDLKKWEANPPEGAPKLLVVSAGTEEANEAMELNSPVVLDQQFNTGRAFGAGGTPSAVLVDEEGKIASEVAVGAPAVLVLAKAEKTGAS